MKKTLLTYAAFSVLLSSDASVDGREDVSPPPSVIMRGYDNRDLMNARGDILVDWTKFRAWSGETGIHLDQIRPLWEMSPSQRVGWLIDNHVSGVDYYMLMNYCIKPKIKSFKDISTQTDEKETREMITQTDSFPGFMPLQVDLSSIVQDALVEPMIIPKDSIEISDEFTMVEHEKFLDTH